VQKLPPLLQNCSIAWFPKRRARAHCRELNTVGRDDRPMAPAIAGGRLAHDLAERPAEGSQTRESDVEADIGDAAVGFAQEEHRALHPSPLQVAVRRLAEHVAEAAAEVRRRDVGHGGDGADVERLSVGAIHGIAGGNSPAASASSKHWAIASPSSRLPDLTRIHVSDGTMRAMPDGMPRLVPPMLATLVPSRWIAARATLDGEVAGRRVRPEQELVVGGMTRGTGEAVDPGALLVGVHEDGAEHYAGTIGAGSRAVRREVAAR
jgi:hypothetical protein